MSQPGTSQCHLVPRVRETGTLKFQKKRLKREVKAAIASGMDFVKPFETPEGDILETMDATGFDLTAPLTPDGLTAKTIERKGEGLNVICFKVPNLDEAIADAKSHGLKVIMGGVLREAKWACFHPRDTFGVMIEIIEYKARCPVLSGFTPPIWEKTEL